MIADDGSDTRSGRIRDLTPLIADDDHKLLDMLRGTLSYEGFRVVIASDGQEARVQVEAERPEAIV